MPRKKNGELQIYSMDSVLLTFVYVCKQRKILPRRPKQGTVTERNVAVSRLLRSDVHLVYFLIRPKNDNKKIKCRN